MEIPETKEAKEILKNIIDRKFEPEVWAAGFSYYPTDYPVDISDLDGKLRTIQGFVQYQANKLDDVIRVIYKLIEDLEYLRMENKMDNMENALIDVPQNLWKEIAKDIGIDLNTIKSIKNEKNKPYLHIEDMDYSSSVFYYPFNL